MTPFKRGGDPQDQALVSHGDNLKSDGASVSNPQGIVAAGNPVRFIAENGGPARCGSTATPATRSTQRSRRERL